MSTLSISHVERGAVLVVSMLFLLVVTIISVVAARNSTFTTKMSSNIQDAYSSFQSAEAGTLATLLLSKKFKDTTKDPFRRIYIADPFTEFSAETSPLRDLNGDPADTNVQVFFNGERKCPPQIPGWSGEWPCEYYRIDSKHEALQRARTQVDMGVVKSLLPSTGLPEDI